MARKDFENGEKRVENGNNNDSAKIRRERSRSREKQTKRPENTEKTDLRKTKKQTFLFEWDASEDTSQQKIVVKQPKIGFGKTQVDALDRADTQKKNLDSESIDQISVRDWRIFRENHDIIVKGQALPVPIRAWSDLKEKIPEQVYENILGLGYEKPTSI